MDYAGSRRRSTPMSAKSELPKTLNELEAELHALQKENFDLKMTIFYQKEMMEKVQGGEEDWMERQRELTEENHELQTQAEEQTQELHERDQRIVQLEEVLERSQRAINRLTDDLKSQSAESKAESTALRERIRQLEETLGRQENDGARHADQLVRAETQADVIRRQLREVEEERARLVSQASSLHQEITDAQGALEQARQRHEQQMERLKQEHREHEDEWEARLHQLQADHREKEAEWTRQVQQFEADRKAKEFAWERQVDTTRRVAQDVEDHKGQIKAAEERAAAAESQLRECQIQIEEAMQEVELHNRQYAEAQSELEYVGQEKERLNAELEKKASEIHAKNTEIEKKNQEVLQLKDQLLVSERSATDASKSVGQKANQLERELQKEKSAKDLILLEMTNLRKAGDDKYKSLVRSVNAMLVQFDAEFRASIKDLQDFVTNCTNVPPVEDDPMEVTMTQTLRQLILPEEDTGVATSLPLSSSAPRPTVASDVQAIGTFVDRWRPILRRLRGVREAVEQVVQTTERSARVEMHHVEDRVKDLDARVKVAEARLQAVKDARVQEAKNRDREIQRWEVHMRHDREAAVSGLEADKAAIEERLLQATRDAASAKQEYESTVEHLQHELADLQTALDDAVAHSKCVEEAEASTRCALDAKVKLLDDKDKMILTLKKEKEDLRKGSEKDRKHLLHELDRLTRQAGKRDEQIANYQRAIVTGGIDVTHIRPISPLARQREVVPPPPPAASFDDVVARTMEETMLMIEQAGQEAEGEKGRLGRPRGDVRVQLVERADAMARCVEELRRILEQTEELVEKWEVRSTTDRSRYTKQFSGWVESLEADVHSLLETQARLSRDFYTHVQEMERLCRQMSRATSTSRSPLRPTTTSAVSNSWRRTDAPAACTSTPPRPRSTHRTRTLGTGTSSAVVSTARFGGADKGGRRGDMDRGATELYARSRGREEREERLVGMSSQQQAMLQQAYTGYGTRRNVGGRRPIANLEKISSDLEEIAAKLDHLKGPNTRVSYK